MTIRNISFLVTGILAVSCAPLEPVMNPVSVEQDRVIQSVYDPSEVGARNATSAIQIEADVRYLASDALEGREAGTQAYRDAANYVADRFQQIGLEPGADGGWFQEVPLRSASRDPALAKMALSDGGVTYQSLTNFEDFIIGQSLVRPEFSLNAPVVYVGYGISAPEDGHDDYANIDVNGKIVALFPTAPDHFNSEKRAFYRSTDYKMKEAAARGAVGFVVLPMNKRLEKFPWSMYAKYAARPSMTWVHPDGRGDVPSAKIKGNVTVGPTGAVKLFSNAAISFEDLETSLENETYVAPFELNKSMKYSGGSTYTEVSSPNVVAVLPGSDPGLADEVVVFTAHLDHVGVHEPRDGGDDHIHNGALDNAIGVATLLDVAERFKTSEAPRRTLVFLALTGEEKGLLGADYYTHYPTVPIDSIVADVNLDMPILLYNFTDIVAFGGERSSLGETIRQAAASMNVAYSPDPIPEEGIFTRSDHYRFVEQGIPSVFLFVGFQNGGEAVYENFLENIYHKPSDDLSQPILFSEAGRFADLNYRIAKSIANETQRPTWVEGDFFGEKFSE